MDAKLSCKRQGRLPVFCAIAIVRIPQQSAAAGIALIASLSNLSGVMSSMALGAIKAHADSLNSGLLAGAALLLAAAATMARQSQR